MEKEHTVKKFLTNWDILQLKQVRYSVRDEIVVEDNSIVILYNDPNNEGFWGSVYVLKQYRGKQIFLKRLQHFMIAVVTLEECGLEEYLLSRKINHKVLRHSKAYKLIQNEYNYKSNETNS